MRGVSISGAGEWYAIFAYMSAPLTPVEETRIIAYLARGDTINEIIENFETEERDTLSRNTIIAVRERNVVFLGKLRDAVLKKEMADAQGIKNKANRIINTQLNTMEQQAEVIAKATQEYIDGDITLGELREFKKAMKPPTMQELVGVSKEMHAQSSNDPATITNPEEAAALTAALEAGDTLQLTQILFKKGGTTEDAQRDSPTGEPLLPA